MTVFDWILIAILCCSATLAFMRGLIRELFALCGLIAGLIDGLFGGLAPQQERHRQQRTQG